MNLVEKITKNKNKILHDIYVIKILLTCLPNEEGMKRCNFIEKLYHNLIEHLDIYIKNETNINYNIINNDYEQLIDLLEVMREEVVVNFRIATLVMLENLKLNEIARIYMEISSILKNYQNIKDACDDIYYHSGQKLSAYICDILDYLSTIDVTESVKKLIPINYLVSKKTIITLSYKDWVEVFESIRITLKYLDNQHNKHYLQLTKQYQELIKYYFIIIIGEDIFNVEPNS